MALVLICFVWLADNINFFDQVFKTKIRKHSPPPHHITSHHITHQSIKYPTHHVLAAFENEKKNEIGLKSISSRTPTENDYLITRPVSGCSILNLKYKK